MMDFVNKLQENEKLKIILVSFLTFFLMIAAIMSNSIVSAYSVINKNDNKPYNYDYYLSYRKERTGRYEGFYYSYVFYFNKPTDYQIIDGNQSKYIRLNYDGDSLAKPSNYYVVYQYFDCEGNLLDTTYANELSSYTIDYKYYSDYTTCNFSTNCTDISKIIKEDGFEVKNDVPPLLTPETVKGIAPAIIKVMKVIIPVGLLIFGAILGIYLLKRLVALFL